MPISQINTNSIANGAVVAADLAAGSVVLTGSAVSGVLPQANGGTGTTIGYNGFKNRIINGAMMIDQRNAGASVSLTGGSTQYTLDRWNAIRVNSGAVSVQRSTTAPAGFVNSLQVTVGTGVATGASDYTTVGQRVEGFNFSDFGWGTANAQPATMSFWVRSSLTGTFGFSIQNPSSYSFIGSYTITAANTWEYKTISIPAPTTSTFPTDNSVCIYINWDLGVGSAFSTTAGSWTASNVFGLTGGVKLSATTGATWNITGVQLEKGSTATSFDYRPYGTELALCQRYFEVIFSNTLNWQGNVVSIYNTTRAFIKGWFKATKRASPTMTVTSPGFDVAYNNSVVISTASNNQYPTVDSVGIEVNGSYTLGYSGHVDIRPGCVITASAEL